jgi:hypothetical protein
MSRTVFLLAIAAVSASWASCGATAGAAPPPFHHHVVSYLVSIGDSADNGVPVFYGVPFSRGPDHPWQWRIFDPVSKRDSFFMNLPSYPMRIRWNSSFTSVEFVAAGRIFRTPWRWGAKMRDMADLPPDSLVCDFWFDTSGRLHVLTQTDLEGVGDGVVAKRWDRGNSGQWTVAAVDTGSEHYGGCFSSARLSEATRPQDVTVTALLDSMRIGNYGDSGIESSGLVWIASNLGPSIGLEMDTATGDTYHAAEPVIWVDSKRRLRKTVYAKGQSQDDAAGQLAFGYREVFLLVVAEYSGAYPAVVDMRSGEVLFKSDRQSSQAVWVPAPR